MTGVNYKKIRHYAPGIRTKQTRLDPDISAFLFKAGVRVTSSTERLIADLSVKAAMPSASGDSDGKKRGLQSARSSKLVNDRGMVYDPNGKKEPGTYLKLHVTEPERKAALMSQDPVANFGWVKQGESNTPVSPPGVKVSVNRYKLDPRTGNPIKSTGHNPFDPFAEFEDKGIQVKGLGKTIGESSTGGKLINFAARAAGVVVDALGKFRCPPGTPAANRFTNERGEGCFAVGAAAEKIVSAMATILTSIDDNESILRAKPNIAESEDRISLVSSLLGVGIPAAKIREAYKRDGIMGLASLASAYSDLGGEGHLVGEKYLDPSHRASIAPTLREAMRLTDGRVERMERIRAKKRQTIKDLMSELDVPETVPEDEEANLINLLKKIGEDPRYGLAADGHVFYVGGTKGEHQFFLRKEFFKEHRAAIASRYPDIVDIDGFEEKFNTEQGTGTPFARAIEAMMERESQMKIGALEQVVIDATEKPEQWKKTKITVDPAGFTKEHQDEDGNTGDHNFSSLNGLAGGEFFYIGSGPAVEGHRGAPPEGSIDIYGATGGLQDQQWAAIAAQIHADETGRYWAHTYSTDLAAMNGEGWRDFGAQVAAHEGYHVEQVYAISQYVQTMSEMGVSGFSEIIAGLPRKDDGSIKKLEDMNGRDLFQVANKFLEAAGPEHLRAALGADIEDLIDRRLDGIAGKYSGDVQQRALKEILKSQDGSVTYEEANRERGVALLETMTELAANRRVGLIGEGDDGGDPELDSFIDKIYSPTPLVPDSIPSTPGGSTVPDGSTPDIPDGGPTPSRPPAIDTPWWSTEDVGFIEPTAPAPRTPSGGGGREFDPFGGRRNSDIARRIRDGFIDTDDVRDLFDGKRENPSDRSSKRKGGLFATWRAQRNMRISSDFKGVNDREKKKYINDLMDDLGIDEVDLNDMRDSILRGDPLLPDEEAKLVKAITKLREKYLEAGQKLKEAIAIREAGCPADIKATEAGSFDEYGGCYAWREGADLAIDQWRDTQSRIGRNLTAPINDIWDLNQEIKRKGGPLPSGGWNDYVESDLPYYLGGMASASRVSQSQNSKLTQGELEIISRAMENTPVSSISSVDKPEYGADFVMLEDIYESYGIKPAYGSRAFDDTETIIPLLTIIDKMKIMEEVIVELEVDEFDYEIGSVIKTDSINKAEVHGKGFASSSRVATAAGVAGRLLNSRAARKAMEKLGIDPENEELISFAAEAAIAFSNGGPAEALKSIAKRANRDTAEKMLGMMVSKGWISPEVAQKVRAYGLDKIAKDGITDDILKAIKEIADSVNTQENKISAMEMIGVLQERASELSEYPKMTSISSPQDARNVIESNKPAVVKTEAEAYTILTELAKMANEAKAAKEAGDPDVKMPNYDFCKVSIPGTNLFCGDSKGIPRKKMPQFSGEPTPGSPADSRPKNKKGEVDGTDDFIKHMEGLGVKVEEKEVLASTLRASQNELVGEKVAGMMTNEDFNPAGEAIFVSRDGYVIDGHHRWAAQVGRDLADGNIGDLPLNVRVVDMDILEVLEEANKFAQEFGIAPKTAGNDAVAVKSVFVNIRFKQLGNPILQKDKPEQKKNTRKQKVRVVVPPGSKAKVEKSGDVLMPPGKMKVTGFGEDGVAEAEITEQVSAIEYMKIAEDKLVESMKKTTDERVKKLLSESAKKYKKSKKDLIISSENYSFSGMSKTTLDKAQGIVDSASQMGYALFNDKNVYINGNKVSVEEYYDTFLKAMRSSIKSIKEETNKDMFPEDKELNRFIKRNSDDQIYKILLKIAGSVFEGIDRRARVSMTKSSLQEFLTSGKIANIDVDSKMLAKMKKNRDTIIGGSVSSSEFSLTPIELMHESNTKRIEQNLFMAGTRVGSEEFTDYGRGIEVVIRSENSKRIGYGRADNEDNEGFYSLLTDDEQQRIMMTVFGNVTKGGQQAKDTILAALYAYTNTDYRGFLNNNGEDIFEGFIVGEISLNDIEHIKIPVSIFNIDKKPLSPSHQIGGKKRVSSMLRKGGMTDAQINDFFDKGGIIGGGYNPKYLTYFLQVEAAQELKQRLISFGIAEVIFTNKNGIDIMGEQTWITPPPFASTGIQALRRLAKMEVDGIIEKTIPQKKDSKPKEKVSP